jgi:hypothetical protein
LGVEVESEEPGPTPAEIGEVRTVVKIRNAKITRRITKRGRQLAIRVFCIPSLTVTTSPMFGTA